MDNTTTAYACDTGTFEDAESRLVYLDGVEFDGRQYAL
jgi:hypothetical protein